MISGIGRPFPGAAMGETFRLLEGEAAFWFAVQTKPCAEERVWHWLLHRHGLPVFLPKIEVIRRRGPSRITIVEPLFPGYLFVQMNAELTSWHKVKWAPGVRRIVCTGDIPTPVPLEVMELLRERSGPGEIMQWRCEFRRGESVRVVHGPFIGLEGILERPTSRGDRVRVLLRILGGVAPVEIDVTHVELVS